MKHACFHCGEPVPASFHGPVSYEGEDRATCCYGCQAVMNAIVEAGLDDYYRYRTEVAALGVVPEDLAAELDSLAIYDEPEFIEQLLVQADETGISNTAEVTLSVEGMRCGACVWLLERTVGALPGVKTATFNYSTGRAYVVFHVNQIALSKVLQRINSVGYQAIPFDASKQEQKLTEESRQRMQRLFVAGIGMMQVMMYALPHYLSDTGDIDDAHVQLLRWASMVLTTPVVLFSAKPFFAGAWRSVSSRSVGMDVPVTIGILAAFSASVWNTLVGNGDTYFDSVSMFVFLLLLARYLEWYVRCRALRSIDNVVINTPETAQLRVGGADANNRPESNYRTVPAMRLAIGDVIRVDSGETVPVDATVIERGGSIDCSVLTGESLPIRVELGEKVPSGALVAGAPLTLSVSQPQKHSTLSVIGKLVERGASDKPLVVKMADQVAGYFVRGLLAFAALVYLGWLVVDPSRAATIAITVLVVSCPCALSLATPAVLAAATSVLLEFRILITRGHALETVDRITDVVLDKTGTLTKGQPAVASYTIGVGQDHDQTLSLAATLEAGAAHPFARAISALAKHNVKLNTLEHGIGGGVSALLEDDRRVRIGSIAWCGLNAESVKQFNYKHGVHDGVVSDVYLCVIDNLDNPSESSILARFSLADPLRDDAKDTIATLLARGLRVHLLSGDQHSVVSDIAHKLGIERWQALASPMDKQRYVQSLQQRGAKVLMIGDGINDAPVLAAADVSMAIGNATTLARTSADTISLASGLSVIPTLLHYAERTAAVIKQNLAWALAYNCIAIPAAAFGYISPWLAAIGMATSSIIVAANAYRLWLRAPKKDIDLKGNQSATRKPQDMLWNH